MGTHTKSSSLVSPTREPLSAHLVAYPELMGEIAVKYFDAADGNLPSFKVLAIEKALGIQSFPDRETAGVLHA
ncbi:hypothetical protein EW146_g8717 [Bondarzewia mesenterica]|uniref:Phosphomannose isomerase type I catalytic domain-containing protein n=1 Tax=Bondarzewia mesenterica TaxID=1095465 RepID=A0A4S4LC22_9AGAM|nr:hypothetical protein EW146_g8717 [Bondarzewia mesenterica]